MIKDSESRTLYGRNPIGIVQGRLVPSEDNRLQGFPLDTWRKEFDLAKSVGLDFIEWIYEWPNCDSNPLMSQQGRKEILGLASASGVQVTTICADYFMDQVLVGKDGEVNLKAYSHLEYLIDVSENLGVKAVVLPFVDQSRLGGPAELQGLCSALDRLTGMLEARSMEVHLELDLNPRGLRQLFSELDASRFKCVYDIGNSASLGYDPYQELQAIGSHLGSVHVKDRVLNGGSVLLGEGDADFSVVFSMLAKSDFSGWFTLQAARDSTVPEPVHAKRNLNFVKEHIRLFR